MLTGVKRISFTANKRNPYRILRVETDLGIINIYIGLSDGSGNAVETMEVFPDHYAGETPVKVIPAGV